MSIYREANKVSNTLANIFKFVPKFKQMTRAK